MTAVLGRGLPVSAGATAVEDAVPASPAATEASPPDRTSAGGPVAPGRLRRAWILPAAVVVAGALALLPTVGDDGPGPGEAEVRVTGVATVERADGVAEVVTDASVRLGPGDVIEVTEGEARFALPDDVAFEGRAEATVADRAGTTVAMGTVPELVAGPLLVMAPEPVTVRAAGSEVTTGPAAGETGAARLDRRLGLGVGTYGGSVVVDSAGRSATVAPLRRLEVAGPGAFGRRDLPLEYSATDPWDRRFLADALLVDRQLGPLLVAFDASAGPGPATVESLRRARPGLPAVGLSALVATAPTRSAALVAAVLADLGTEGTFPARVGSIGRFRDDGAPWGLVALDQGVTPDALLGGVRAALDRLGPDRLAAEGADGDESSSAPVAAGESPPSESGPAGGSGETGGGSAAEPSAGPEGGGSDGGPAPSGSAPSGGGGGPPSTALPPVTVPPGVLPPVPVPGLGDDPVGEVVEGAGDTVGDVVESVGDVVEDVGQAVGQGVSAAGAALEDVVDGLLDTAGRLLGGTPAATPPGGGLLGLGGR